MAAPSFGFLSNVWTSFLASRLGSGVIVKDAGVGGASLHGLAQAGIDAARVTFVFCVLYQLNLWEFLLALSAEPSVEALSTTMTCGLGDCF